MTCEEFCEGYIEAALSRIVDEDYWDGGVDTSGMFRFMVERAKEMSVELVDVGVWDYDSYFYNWHQCAEKGLS